MHDQETLSVINAPLAFDKLRPNGSVPFVVSLSNPEVIAEYIV